MGSVVDLVPPELLVECFRAADQPTRLRASHVSRRWRAVALADCRLWDNFSCSAFRDEQHQDVMFGMLQAMLIRSRSLPFKLHIPHRYCGGTTAEYKDRLLRMNDFDVRRLSVYAGPAAIFAHMNSHGILPTMTTLNVLEVCPVLWPIIVLDGEFSSRILPNLQILHADYIAFPLQSPAFLALRDLTCSVSYAFDFDRLFHLCPNLVNLALNALNASVRLPPLALPQSLRSIALRPERNFILHIPKLLHNWTRVRLPQLVVHEVESLKGVLPLFDARHRGYRIELRLHSREDALTLAAISDDGARACVWTITPSPIRAEFLRSLETPACPRLKSLSVPMAQLCGLLVANFHCPGLVRLEFRLHGKLDWPLVPAHNDDQFFIRTPRLQHVVFSASDTRVDADEVHGVLGVLRASFRALIRYDVELLESITLSAPAAIVQAMDCADFSRFAKEYTIRETS